MPSGELLLEEFSTFHSHHSSVGVTNVMLDELANHFIRLDATHGRNAWQRLSHVSHN